MSIARQKSELGKIIIIIIIIIITIIIIKLPIIKQSLRLIIRTEVDVLSDHLEILF